MKDKKDTKEFFLGKGTIKFFPMNGKRLKDVTLSKNWIKLGNVASFNVECKSEGICPICEYLGKKED